MQVQINTDENVEGGEEFIAKISGLVQERLERFSQHITRIEMHLSDTNAKKAGVSNMRCLIEARLEGRQPEAVSEEAATIEGAYTSAIQKLQRVLESTLGKLNHHKGAETIRTGPL